MENLDMYHDFAAKLSASKKSVEVDESLRDAYHQQSEILQDLREQNDKTFFLWASRYFMIFSASIFLVHILFEGLWVGLLGIILTAGFFPISKILMTRKTKEVSRVNLTENKTHHLLTKTDLTILQSLNLRIIDLRLTRNILLLIISVVLTPLIFLSLHELIIGEVSPLIFGLAVLSGSFPWMIYFHTTIDLLKKKKIKIAKI
ncbi:hypothetical protein [Portibacter marinus]|uniref:hypothetical protein n=1 Tax=Portibacter marinus TaxID=2898660 RepID=UPI001F2EC589|nr:hypothetical protein [Portibacter marinus]